MNSRTLTDSIRAALAEDIRHTCARLDAARLGAWARFGVLLLVLALAGCGTTQTVVQSPPALAVVCDDACKKPCPDVTAIRWLPPDVLSGEAWKLLVSDVLAKAVKFGEECEAQRQACNRCIQTIERSGRVCGTFEACD